MSARSRRQLLRPSLEALVFASVLSMLVLPTQPAGTSRVFREVHKAQSAASFEFDEAMHNYLFDSAPDDREKQRLLRVVHPHAGSFVLVTSVPSEEDSKDCLLKPRRTAVAYRLGIPVLRNEVPLCACSPSTYMATTPHAAQRTEI